ncbi:hypothetical protein NBRC116495_31900 [Aurantivibrio plasticivorans]
MVVCKLAGYVRIKKLAGDSITARVHSGNYCPIGATVGEMHSLESKTGKPKLSRQS